MEAEGLQWSLEACFTHRFNIQLKADKDCAKATASLCAR